MYTEGNLPDPDQADGIGDLRVRCGRAGLDLLCFSLLR
jgi:hypothetical protein